MNNPQLLLINGPAGIGKTTIAKKYIEDNPLALMISADDIITFLGRWVENEPQARQLTFELVTSMAVAHLKSGHNVVVPHLLTNADEAATLEAVAASYNATFFECVLLTDKEEAIERMHERGSWGEPGSPPLTKADTPIIEELFDKVHIALAKRPNTVHITSVKGDSDGTYRQVLAALAKQQVHGSVRQR